MEYKEYGYFADGGKEYVITERKTPRHWYNYYFNRYYNAFASQVGVGEGIAEDYLATRLFLVSDRCVYITDKKNKTFHTAVGLPMTEKFDFYECRHKIGSSTIICEKNGIRTEFTIFVPLEKSREQWIVKVKNLRDECAKLSVIGYAATETDNIYRAQSYNSESAHFDEKNELIYSTVMTKMHRDNFGICYPYMISDGKLLGYDTRKTAFIGTYGSKDAPEALIENCGCTNSETFVEKICYALEDECKLGIGEEKAFCFEIGYVKEKDELSSVRANLADVEKNLAEVMKKRAEEISGVTIKTPDEKLNCAFNNFYKYSTMMGSRWARVRHNGFRDRMSDTECLSTYNPKLAWENYKLGLEYQYSNGYAPRTVIDGAIRPNNFSDCAVWITMTGHTLVSELGDLSLLDEEVKFNDGSVGTVFEHMKRAVDYLYDFKGENGLIKIWGGDWNDGMNLAGLEGKGVSVWLSIAWCKANKLLCELAGLRGETELVAKHLEMEKSMEELIEKYGWDGEYYITAINDFGEKIGSKECKYGKMYLNPQTWAIFSEIGTEERRKAIYEKVDEYLETPMGTLVNKPGYEEPDCHVGFMTFRPVGSLINSTVYLHPMAWKLAAEAMLKRPEKLEMTLKKILPWNHEYCMTYGEPYTLYNMYHGPETNYRYGTPGQSFRTATAPVFVKNIIRYVFGLATDINGMKLEPVLPPEWKECGIKKAFRGCVYDISYHQAETHTCTVEKVLVDGKEYKEKYLPCEAGKEYKIDVYLK